MHPHSNQQYRLQLSDVLTFESPHPAAMLVPSSLLERRTIYEL